MMLFCQNYSQEWTASAAGRILSSDNNGRQSTIDRVASHGECDLTNLQLVMNVFKRARRVQKFAPHGVLSCDSFRGLPPNAGLTQSEVSFPSKTVNFGHRKNLSFSLHGLFPTWCAHLIGDASFVTNDSTNSSDTQAISRSCAMA
jgi:hypothetical protein